MQDIEIVGNINLDTKIVKKKKNGAFVLGFFSHVNKLTNLHHRDIFLAAKVLRCCRRPVLTPNSSSTPQLHHFDKADGASPPSEADWLNESLCSAPSPSALFPSDNF